tara:strand:- start:637 stop:1281 length:645 start_codon:yes stop_codon:yes gene_type:complete
MGILNKPIKILSIDVGITNLALVGIECYEDYRIKNINICKKIDIQNHRHEKINRVDCNLHHTSSISDGIAHLFQEFSYFFDEASVILIERQPLMGIQSVQELIYHSYRDKALLISPQAVHKHLLMKNLNYEERKEKSVNIAWAYLNNQSDFNDNDRKHDMADALCQSIYYLDQQRTKYDHQKKREEIKQNLSTCGIDWEKFIYRGSRRASGIPL